MRHLSGVFGECLSCQLNCLHYGISRDSALETVDNILDGTSCCKQVQCTGYFDSRVLESWSAATNPRRRNDELSQWNIFIRLTADHFSNLFSVHGSSPRHETGFFVPSYSKYA